MPKTVHVHIHATRDSWEENKHPRANNGQFGSGSGGGNKATSGRRLAIAANRSPAEKAVNAKHAPKIKELHAKMDAIRLKNRMAGGAGGRERPKESPSHHQENHAYHSQQAAKMHAETEAGKKKGWPASSLPDQKLLQYHKAEASKHAAGIAAWKKYSES